MAGVAIEDNGAGRSFSGVSTGQQQQRCQSGEALVEWRSSEQVENGSPSTSPPYWDSDDDDDGGPKPSELYGKYTWKIDKFSQINKRELRSDAFEVGGYKWYILIYPQGCDVCNHLSLFLCVANHDKLLPGWSHFAQFTIAVVNKDPKKSKYSDTLHRFWKKEHDWGWKKFMELSKVLDGFIDADTLIIKAQVQVIRERADRPFRCLDCQYKRELVRVYLTNVEQICRRFVEEHRAKLGKLLEDKARWSSFCTFWLGMDLSSRRRMSREKTDSILKVVVKHFFIEKEVTSTLVMDSLYSGLKSLESQNVSKKSKGKYIEEELPVPIVVMEKDTFVLVDDVLLLLERAAIEPLPPKDEKGPQNRTKDGTVGEEFNKDSIERDERRLTELGRRTIEIFVLAHIFSKIEVSYQEAVALKKQEELIREEEAAWLAEIELKARRGALDKEKKSKKKQSKQKKNSRKGKDKGRDDKTSSSVQDRIEQDSPAAENKEIAADLEIVLEKSEAVEDVSDVSDSADGVPEIPLVSEDTVGPVSWGTDISEIHSSIEASGSGVIGLSGVQNGTEGRVPSPLDDASSTCSSDSVLSIRSMQHKGKSMYDKNQKSPTRWKNHQVKLTSRISDWVSEEPSQPLDTGHPKDASRSSNRAEFQPYAAQPFQDNVVNGTKGKKDDAGSSSRNVSAKGSVDVELCLNIAACVASPPRSPSNSIAPLKSEPRSNAPSGVVLVKKASSDSPKQGDTLVLRTTSSENTTPSKPVPLKISTLKPAEKPSGNQKHVASEKLPSEELIEPGQHKFASSKPADKPLTDKPSTPPIPAVSRPLSAPLVPGPRPAVSVVSMVQTAPVLARSVSAAGRLGPETTAYTSQCYVPQSYRNAMMGGPVAAASSSAYQNHSASSVMNSSHAYSQAATLVSAPLFSPHSSDRMDPSPIKPSISFGMVNHHDMLQNGTLWIEHTHRNGIRNPHGDHNSLVNEMQHLDLNGLPQGRSQDHVPPDFPACTSGRPNHVLLDDFPHLDIINDLLDDEHGVGVIARANSEYHRLGSGHHMNRQHTFPGDQSGPGLAVSSSSFDRMRNYHDNGFQHGYGASGRSYDALLRDMVPGASSRPYGNSQVDGFMPNQWQMGGSDSALLSVRNMENDGYPYIPEYPNVGVGINGYTVFRPSNGL